MIYPDLTRPIYLARFAVILASALLLAGFMMP